MRADLQTGLCYGFDMTITLTPKQQQWLEAEVAAGRFASVQEAVEVAIVGLMHPPEDLSWAKPYLDVARGQIERGEVVALEDFNAHVDGKLKGLR